ncbi:MAG: hypothetical protein II113_00865, partial [Firmicutes bacterium]|nr:hypothetical protein [Bacillota bacterium]
AKASDAKQEELMHHIDEMEAMGYDMTEYRASLKEKIGGASREEYEAAKRETLMNDRSMVRAHDYVSNEGETEAASEAYSKAIESSGADDPCDEARPDCNRQCKTCFRKHCKWRNTDY